MAMPHFPLPLPPTPNRPPTCRDSSVSLPYYFQKTVLDDKSMFKVYDFLHWLTHSSNKSLMIFFFFLALQYPWLAMSSSK